MWIAAACAVVVASPVAAADVRAGDLLIEHSVIVKAFSGARVAGGYMMITNSGDDADRLIDVSSGEVPTMIHASIEAEGVVRMVHIDAVDIPAGKRVIFEPGGLHVMFMGLQPGKLSIGATLNASLSFEAAGEVAVIFEVVDLQRGGE